MVPPTVSHKHVKFSNQLIAVTDINIGTLIPNLEVFAQNSKSGNEVVIGTFSCPASCLLSKFLAIRNYLKSIKVKYINSIYVHAL